MQSPDPETITLADILITDELSRRLSRAPNLQAENQVMRMLIHQMAQGSETLLQSSVETALELCAAGTTGVSLLETTLDGAEIFRWNALAGTLAHHVGGSTPRNFSPCGVCLDQGIPVLFAYPLDPVHRERLELVHRNSLRLLKLVNTLLDFSRIEAGCIEAVYEPVDLAMFTTELASVFRSAVEQAGLQLIVDCPPLPEPVFVGREMWEKIVLNLLSNAFKFTLEGEIRVSLRSADGNQALLQIQDTGTGIAPEHLPHLFERFYQVRGTQARTHEGSGIGLALVHELVRLHGGTIDVSSTVGEGTCFTISIPFGTDHLPSDRLHLEGDRIPTRILASTAMGAASYVEEAERWLPEGSGGAREWGSKGVEENPSPHHPITFSSSMTMPTCGST